MSEGELKTRDCTDPWETVFVQADGRVALCCWAPAIGNLDSETLDEIVGGSAARALRAELLEGQLNESCRACPARGWTTTKDLDRRVVSLLTVDPVEEIENLNQRVFRLESERAQLVAHTTTLEAEREQLIAHSAALEAEREQLLAHVDALEKEREPLLPYISALESERTRLESTLEQVVADREALDRKLKQIHARTIHKIGRRIKQLFARDRGEST